MRLRPQLEVVAPPRYRWYHVLSAVIFILFCLELGLFLVLFPWSQYWEANFFFSRRYWDSAYVRGGVSGLGVVNLYISLLEILRLRRFSKT